MRTLAALVLVLVLVPAASALVSLPEGRSLTAPSAPGEDARFRVPVVASEDVELYLKLLPTPGNAVHDGTRANGTLEPPSGWRVSFDVDDASGTRTGLGARNDSTPTEVFPLAAGARATLVITLHQPADARDGGVVYVALAERSGSAPSPGASGAQADPSQALTLRLGTRPASGVDVGEDFGAPVEPEETPFLTPIALAFALALALVIKYRR